MEVTLEELKKALDSFANVTHEKEFLAIKKQDLIRSVIPAEHLNTLSEIDVEFADKEKGLEEKEKAVRKRLDMLIEAYAESLFIDKKPVKVSADLATVSFSRGKVVWNTEGLDRLIVEKGMTELLEYRTEEPPNTRVTKKGVSYSGKEKQEGIE